MIIGGSLFPFLHRYARWPLALILPLLTIWQIYSVGPQTPALEIGIGGFFINPLVVGPYTKIFAYAFAIAAFAGALFGLFQSNKFETAVAFIYAGAAIGITFSGDYISLFLYWELMAVASTIIIFCSDHEGAMSAGVRYAFVHLLGGLLFMVGIMAHIALDGSAALIPFETDTAILLPGYALDMNGAVMWMIMSAILINLAVPPISAWLPDAYPKSSPFGAVYLSAFTTKAAVFVLLTLFAGTEILTYVGLAMIFFSLIYAVLENDMRRLLSYGIINQLGFMVFGIGVGSDLSIAGVVTHAFASVIYTCLLFMVTGAVLHLTEKSKFSDLQGLSKPMRFTVLCAVVGALSMSAFPLTIGFVSKSMTVASVMTNDLRWMWFFLVAASAGVAVYSCAKFAWFGFFQKEVEPIAGKVPLNMKLAMGLLALLCIIPAIPTLTERTLYQLLPAMPDYHAYTTEHVVTQLQLLLFAMLAFFIGIPLFKRKATITLDFDWFYRAFGKYILVVIAVIGSFAMRIGAIVARKTVRKFVKALYYIHHPQGLLARNWSLGTTVIWVVAMLGVYMVVYFL
jgi:multicomponent Na+:H+ antiporter subunit D